VLLEEPVLGEVDGAEAEDVLALEEESDEELDEEAAALPPESLLDSDLPESLLESDFPASEDFASLPLFVAGDFAPDLA